jgi:hypothetical protein
MSALTSPIEAPLDRTSSSGAGKRGAPTRASPGIDARTLWSN